jgi:hypothetical protein
MFRLMLPELAMSIAEHIEGGGDTTTGRLTDLIEQQVTSWNIKEFVPLRILAHNLATELAKPAGGSFDAVSLTGRRLARAAGTECPVPSGQDVAERNLGRGGVRDLPGAAICVTKACGGQRHRSFGADYRSRAGESSLGYLRGAPAYRRRRTPSWLGQGSRRPTRLRRARCPQVSEA